MADGSANKEVKPGWKTTEFLMTVVFHIAAIALAATQNVDAQWATIASAIAQAAYNWSRGHAKS